MLKRVQLSIQPDHVKDLGHGVVEVVVATESLDYHGEKMNIAGINTKKYNGVVLWGHDYSSLPIGKSVSLRKVDGKLISKTQFAINEYPFAKTVYDMVVAGFIPDVSIGFIPEEWDTETDTWVKSSMIEYSHVPIGANPEAKVTAKAFGVDIDKFEAEEKEFMSLKQEPLAKSSDTSDNAEVIALFATIKHAVGDIDTQLKELRELTQKPSQEQSSTPSKRQIKKRLVLAKRSTKSVDSLSESLTRAINDKISQL